MKLFKQERRHLKPGVAVRSPHTFTSHVAEFVEDLSVVLFHTSHLEVSAYFLQLLLSRMYPMPYILYRFKQTLFLIFRLGDLSFDANFGLRLIMDYNE